ncbi:MAG: hypothetical protein ACYTDY_00850 [Planctomycetota bacterium]|jgi:hypothetical protein
MRAVSVTAITVLFLPVLLVSCDSGDEDETGLTDLPFGEDFAFRNPMVDAQPREWALYRLMDGREMRWEVVQVHPRSRVATVEEVTRDPKVDKLLGTDVREFGPNHILANFLTANHMLIQIYFDEIDVAGKRWWALCVDTASGMTGRVRQWYSPDVPVVGLLRMERVLPRGTQVQSELIDWSGRVGR